MSYETDTLRRAARFLALFCRAIVAHHQLPTSRATSLKACTTSGAEMGVFRYPTADLNEVVTCCKRGRVYRDAKRRLIEDTLDVWDRFRRGPCPSRCHSCYCAVFLEERGRHPSARSDFWRSEVGYAQEGVRQECRIPDGRHRSRFEARLDRCVEGVSMTLRSWTPLPAFRTSIHGLRAAQDAVKKDEARKLIEQIQVLYPKDGQALISLGRLLAIHAEDAPEAEKLVL